MTNTIIFSLHNTRNYFSATLYCTFLRKACFGFMSHFGFSPHIFCLHYAVKFGIWCPRLNLKDDADSEVLLDDLDSCMIYCRK